LARDEVRIGDQVCIGSVLLEVTQPRTPCVKLAMRFQRPAIVREFMHSRPSGFYCSVLREGEVAAGDAITWGERALGMASISELIER
jgi:MOSC domain-containing protein YiiM